MGTLGGKSQTRLFSPLSAPSNSPYRPKDIPEQRRKDSRGVPNFDLPESQHGWTEKSFVKKQTGEHWISAEGVYLLVIRHRVEFSPEPLLKSGGAGNGLGSG